MVACRNKRPPQSPSPRRRSRRPSLPTPTASSPGSARSGWCASRAGSAVSARVSPTALASTCWSSAVSSWSSRCSAAPLCCSMRSRGWCCPMPGAESTSRTSCTAGSTPPSSASSYWSPSRCYRLRKASGGSARCIGALHSGAIRSAEPSGRSWFWPWSPGS